MTNGVFFVLFRPFSREENSCEGEDGSIFIKFLFTASVSFLIFRFARFIAVVTMETRKRIGSNESPDGGEISYIDVGDNLTLITSRRAKGRHGMPRTVSWRL